MFALLATGVRAGDVVLTVPNTFIATAEAISQAGAVPDFVDINEDTYNVDVDKLAEYLETQCYVDQQTGKLINRKLQKPVTAIIPVHLYGQPADMDPIVALAERYQLIVIEDACQAHGAAYRSNRGQAWKKAGSMGRAAAFSFYPGKNLGACGEGGAVTTSDESIARKIRMLRDHGQTRKYYHEVEGYNGRLDAIQAGILSAKLRHLQQWNDKRRVAAERYRQLFRATDAPLVLPYEPAWSHGVHHLFVVRVQNREDLQKYLADNKIGTGIHYPVPVHQQPAYAGRLASGPSGLGLTERAAPQILSLPIYPQLPDEAVDRVISEIRTFFD